jgi:hypothetical protein
LPWYLGGMEFTYKISEQELIRAAKLYRKSSVNSKVKKIIFIAFVVICLVLLFAVVMKIREGSVENVSREPTSVTTGHILQQAGPLVLIAAFWIVLIFVWPRIRLRGIYRKSPVLQGTVTVQVTLDALSVETSTGSTSRTRWNDMKMWHEGNGLILLVYPTKIYQIVNVKDLSELQLGEFRSILTTALPSKK